MVRVFRARGKSKSCFHTGSFLQMWQQFFKPQAQNRKRKKEETVLEFIWCSLCWYNSSWLHFGEETVAQTRHRQRSTYHQIRNTRLDLESMNGSQRTTSCKSECCNRIWKPTNKPVKPVWKQPTVVLFAVVCKGRGLQLLHTFPPYHPGEGLLLLAAFVNSVRSYIQTALCEN